MILRRDEAFRTVCELRTPCSDGGVSIGTGMFVSSSAGLNKLYGWIVTASHVARCTNEYTQIVIESIDDKAQMLPLKMFGELVNWRHHPVADISVFQIVISHTNEVFMETGFYLMIILI